MFLFLNRILYVTEKQGPLNTQIIFKVSGKILDLQNTQIGVIILYKSHVSILGHAYEATIQVVSHHSVSCM